MYAISPSFRRVVAYYVLDDPHRAGGSTSTTDSRFCTSLLEPKLLVNDIAMKDALERVVAEGSRDEYAGMHRGSSDI